MYARVHRDNCACAHVATLQKLHLMEISTAAGMHAFLAMSAPVLCWFGYRASVLPYMPAFMHGMAQPDNSICIELSFVNMHEENLKIFEITQA